MRACVRACLQRPFKTKARELVGMFIELAQCTLQRVEDLTSAAFSKCTLQRHLTKPIPLPARGAPAASLPCAPLSDPTTEGER